MPRIASEVRATLKGKNLLPEGALRAAPIVDYFMLIPLYYYYYIFLQQQLYLKSIIELPSEGSG